MPNTADQQITVPDPATVAASALAQSIADAALDLERGLVKVYTTLADRNTRNPTPSDGQMSILASSPDVLHVAVAGGWRAHPRGSKAVTVGGVGSIHVAGDLASLIAETTITDPLGAGVPYLLNIAARTVFELDSGQRAYHVLKVDAVVAKRSPAFNPILTAGADRMHIMPALDHRVSKATGGSVTVRSEFDVDTPFATAPAGNVAVTADARNNGLEITIHPYWP